VSDVARCLYEREGAESLCLGYRQGDSPSFPGAVCICVNEEVVHAIPGPRLLHAGDVVTIDIGIRLDGWCADMATSLIVDPGDQGSVDERVVRLVRTAKWLTVQMIRLMRPGVPWSVIAQTMERIVEASGFGIVTQYIGHGIGRTLHESPKAPAFWSGFSGPDFVLEPGLVLAIEPILTLGRGEHRPCPRGASAEGSLPRWRMPVRLLPDSWTVVTADGLPACHEERMVRITQGDPEVLGDPCDGAWAKAPSFSRSRSQAERSSGPGRFGGL